MCDVLIYVWCMQVAEGSGPRVLSAALKFREGRSLEGSGHSCEFSKRKCFSRFITFRLKGKGETNDVRPQDARQLELFRLLIMHGYSLVVSKPTQLFYMCLRISVLSYAV